MKRDQWLTEAVAGLTTFLTMSYIVVVNPSILSTSGTGMPFSGVMTATVLLAFTMTLVMGLYAKLPFAVAPGMGVNAFFTFSLILGQHIPWPTALGMVFWSGVLFLLVSATGLREAMARAIPPNLRSAAAVGIGIFLSFIGLKNCGLVAPDPVTYLKLGELDPRNGMVILGTGLMVVLLRRKSPFAFLAGIGAITLVGLAAGWVKRPESFFASPDFSSVFFKLDLAGSLKPALWPAILSLMFTDLFDSLSTFVGVSVATGLVDEKGEPQRLREGLLVDALATLSAGLFGTSSGTAYIESSAGIEVGGRTGLTSVFTALCFLPCLFLAPLAGTVPEYATAPVLIIVGSLMFRAAADLAAKEIENSFPAFLTAILIPLTFSITQGILWGFIAHTGLYVLVGRWREVTRTMYALSFIALGLLVLQHGHW